MTLAFLPGSPDCFPIFFAGCSALSAILDFSTEPGSSFVVFLHTNPVLQPPSEKERKKWDAHQPRSPVVGHNFPDQLPPGIWPASVVQLSSVWLVVSETNSMVLVPLKPVD